MSELKGPTGVVGTPGDPGIPNESPQGTPVTDNTDYIKALQEMKEKTVSKEAYVQLKEENKKLLQSLINGETIEAHASQETPDVGQLRKDLFSRDGNLTNLEYAEKALQLRDILIEEGKPDPFLPYGHHISPTNEDIEAANRVARVLKDCIEYADGDSDLFKSELQRNMVDVPNPRAKGRK